MVLHLRFTSACSQIIFVRALDRFGIQSLQFLRVEVLNLFSCEAEYELNTELEIGVYEFCMSGNGLLVLCAAQLL